MTPCPVCYDDAEIVEGRCFGCGFKRGIPVRECTDCGYTSCPGYCGGLSERRGMVPGEIPGRGLPDGQMAGAAKAPSLPETPRRSLNPSTGRTA